MFVVRYSNVKEKERGLIGVDDEVFISLVEIQVEEEESVGLASRL